MRGNTRSVVLYATLLIGYSYIGAFRLFLTIFVPLATDPYYNQSWYEGPVAHLAPAFLAALVVGWMTSWRMSLFHGIGMGGATVAAYALVDLVKSPETQVEPMTWKTAPFFFLALSAFYLSGTLVGSLSHLVWRKLNAKTTSSATT